MSFLANNSVGSRLGIPAPITPLLVRLHRLRAVYPLATAARMSDWLAAVAMERGARTLARPLGAEPFSGPGETELSNEELICGLLHPAVEDVPQYHRLAAELISKRRAKANRLAFLARQNCVERVLLTLALEIQRNQPEHELWAELAAELQARHVTPHPRLVLPWTRLADPVMAPGRPNAMAWRLPE
jgi:hypothetical protein